MQKTATIERLKPQTLEAFSVHIRNAEAVMEESLEGNGPFLWSDTDEGRAGQVRQGRILAQFWSGQGPVKVPDGLIHDWIAAALIPGVIIENVLALVQDYNHHKDIYQPEVVASKLLNRRGNDFEIYLRLLKKKVMTVVLDTDHEVHYRSLDPKRWLCRSYTTRIAEVEHAGTSNETVLPPDTGYGFLWRLYSYWRFQERDGAVWIECRAVSLTRDVPFGLGWIIEPIVQKLPKESLISTLEATRRALQASAK